MALIIPAGAGTSYLYADPTDHDLVIGSTTGTSAWTQRSGTGAMTFTAGGNFDANVVGDLTMDAALAAITATGAASLRGGSVSLLEGATTVFSSVGGAVGVADVQAAGSLSIGSAMVAGTISIGGSAQTGQIGIGLGAANQTLRFGDAAAGDKTTKLGSLSGASITALQGGTAGIDLTAPLVRVGTAIRAPNTGLWIFDTDASHVLKVVPGSNLSADRNLTFLTGDASRSVDLSGAQGSVYYVDASGNTVPLAPGTDGYKFTTHGAAQNPTWEPDAGAGESGTAEVNFGAFVSVEAEQSFTSVVVAAAWVAADDVIVASPMAIATADHGPEDYGLEQVTATVGNIDPGVSFTIYASAPNGTWGRYQIGWMQAG